MNLSNYEFKRQVKFFCGHKQLTKKRTHTHTSFDALIKWTLHERAIAIVKC